MYIHISYFLQTSRNTKLYHWFKVITWKPCIFNTRSVYF